MLFFSFFLVFFTFETCVYWLKKTHVYYFKHLVIFINKNSIGLLVDFLLS